MAREPRIIGYPLMTTFGSGSTSKSRSNARASRPSATENVSSAGCQRTSNRCVRSKSGCQRRARSLQPSTFRSHPPHCRLFGDIGAIAAKQVIDGVQSLVIGEGWPSNLGQDVRAEVAEIARVLDHGITSLSISTSDAKALVTTESRPRLALGPREIANAEAVIVGRLMETDYHDLTLEIHPAAGPVVKAHYSDEIERDVREHAKNLVSASGWAKRDSAGRNHPL